METRKALGRGLAALIPDLPTLPLARQEETSFVNPGKGNEPTSSPEFFYCALDEIAPSVDNPRHHYDQQRMQELCDSIRLQGLIQPLVVRKRTKKESFPPSVKFVLIAGERRFRAAQMVSLSQVPVVIKNVSLDRAFELALVENLQREDLNPIEEAEAYKRLSFEFGYSQEKLAERVGRARETVANSLRLLKLPKSVQTMVVLSELSMGHARALLALEDPGHLEQMARQVAIKQLSVRQTEELVRKMRRTAAIPQTLLSKEKSTALLDLERKLQENLGAKVKLVSKTSNKGRIEIEYASLDQFEHILSQLLTPK